MDAYKRYLLPALLAALLIGAAPAQAKTVNGCPLKQKTNCAGKKLNWKLEFHGKLNGANFRNAKMRGADLRNANLKNADLRGADLTSADLRGAWLVGPMNRPENR